MQKLDKLDQMLARAGQLFRAGDQAGAVKLCHEAVATAPHHVAANNLLGLAYVQSGDAERAVPFLQKALELDPNLPSGHYNLGTVLQGLRRYDEARQHYELALARQPDDAELHSNLGALLRGLDQAERAISHLIMAIKLNPQLAAAHFNLGLALLGLRRNDEAVTAFERAAVFNPRHAEAHLNWGQALAGLSRHEEALARFGAALALNGNLAEAHIQRGDMLQKLGRHAESITCYRQALVLNPDLLDIEYRLAATLNELLRYDEAIESCRRVLAVRPGDAGASRNLANAMRGLHRYDDAIDILRQVLTRDPDHAPAYSNLGMLLEAVDRNDEALASYKHAIRLDPDDIEAGWNKGLLDLSLGHFSEGWPPFEHRFALGITHQRRYPAEQWTGGPVEGTLLVWGEQGLGDQIIYSSMIRDLEARIRSVRIEIEPRLVPLFARSFPGIEMAPLGSELQPGTIAAHVALGSLGRHLRPDWASFKQPAPAYLKADPVRTADLHTRLTREGRAVIGLSWQSANPKMGDAKTADLRDFAAVLRLPGCRFIDLQYGDTQIQRRAVLQEQGVEVERLADIDNRNDIDGLAALISACDLVLTVSNTTAHLSGALGTPTWVLLPSGNARFWYWFRDRDDSPWYPRVHLKRRIRDQSWTDLVCSLAPEIAAAAIRRLDVEQEAGRADLTTGPEPARP